MFKNASKLISSSRKAEYERTYGSLMARAAGREYIKGFHERHHIIPRSMGGSNSKSNLVCLTYREHFLAHWLLIKFTNGKDHIKMLHALVRMTGKNKNNFNRRISSWQFSIAKKKNIEALQGNNYCKGKLVGDNNPSRKMSKEKLKQRAEKARITRQISRKGFGDNHPFKKPEVVALISGENYYNARSCINLTTTEIFTTLNAAGAAYGVNPTCIKDACKGRQKTSAGCKWSYLEDYKLEAAE